MVSVRWTTLEISQGSASGCWWPAGSAIGPVSEQGNAGYPGNGAFLWREPASNLKREEK